MGIICNKWPLDGSPKPLVTSCKSTMAYRDTNRPLGYTARAYEQSVLVCVPE